MRGEPNEAEIAAVVNALKARGRVIVNSPRRAGKSALMAEVRARLEAPARYLSRTEVAERIGVKPATLSRYKLPEPDAITGTVRGWLPATIDAWQAGRRPRK